MPVISASLFARFASRQQSSPTLQAVAALRGQFGGHQVMTVTEGEELRSGDSAGPASPKAAARRAKTKEKPPATPGEAADKGRRAASAGPSSGAGTTTGPKKPSGGPTSGTGTTRKRAARKS